MTAPNTIHRLFTTVVLKKDGTLDRPWLRWFSDLENKTRQTLTVLGQLQPSTVLAGRNATIAQSIDGKAPLVSPVLTGTPIAPTAPTLTNNTQIATTSYADSAVSVEKTRAQTAEASNASAISAETTRAEAAEATNATAISTETTRAEAAEALLAPIASPTFTGTVTEPVAVLTAATPTVGAGKLGLGTTTAATATAGAATLPANPLGFLVLNLAGTTIKVPYYSA